MWTHSQWLIFGINMVGILISPLIRFINLFVIWSPWNHWDILHSLSTQAESWRLNLVSCAAWFSIVLPLNYSITCALLTPICLCCNDIALIILHSLAFKHPTPMHNVSKNCTWGILSVMFRTSIPSIRQRMRVVIHATRREPPRFASHAFGGTCRIMTVKYGVVCCLCMLHSLNPVSCAFWILPLDLLKLWEQWCSVMFQ